MTVQSTLRESTEKVSPSTVESASRPGLLHTVTLEPESCSCEATVPVCRHIRIARIRAAKASERPCACLEGYVYVGYLDVDEETGEEVERHARYRCRRCG